jgi:putative glutamine amidotransferase
MVTSSAGETRTHVLYTKYTTMIREAGGVPVVLTPGPATEVDMLLDRIDGLLLSGGGDIAPGRYGGMAHEAIYEVDPLRDEFELALAHAARDRLLPTLAICRGMQIANVAFGGTLFEDIGSHYPDALEHRRHGAACSEPQHGVELDPDSTTAAAVGKDMVEVNTIHHQSVRQVGSAFRVTGRAPDGIIESVEPTDASWPMWGVQWHPEYLGVGDEPSMSLFRTFVAAAERP